jgi:AcrR family transcriptional regulator
VTVLDQILQAALEEFSEVGVRHSSIEDIARRLGLSRATVYRYVGAKGHLIELVIQAETRRAIRELDRALNGHPDVATAVEVGFVFLVRFVRDHPLFDRLLHREPELVLPWLTINAGPALATYRSLIAERLERWQQRGEINPVNLDRAAEAIARLGLSLVLTPDGVTDLNDPAAIAAFAREAVEPMLKLA